jgi:crossover junction endodeoxyribonuclease RuvC
MTYIIGIDPGATGAVAILTHDGQLVQVSDMPVVEIAIGGKTKRRISPEMLVAELRGYCDSGTCAVVEQVSAMPGQGVSSMFAFGQAYGLALGVLAGLWVPTTTVTPSVWKKAMRLGTGKDAARAEAARRWPAQAGQFARVKDDGRAEAALLADWRRMHG